MTSAPRSARIIPQVGPITMCVNSITRTPESGRSLRSKVVAPWSRQGAAAAAARKARGGRRAGPASSATTLDLPESSAYASKRPSAAAQRRRWRSLHRYEGPPLSDSADRQASGHWAMATSAFAASSSLPRPARWAAWVVAGIAALLLVLVLVLLFFPWNALREPIANYYSEQTGRKVVIAGDLTVKLAWHPWIDVRGIAIANAPWSDEPVMASVERLGHAGRAAVAGSRACAFRRWRSRAPRAILERNVDGVGNWVTRRRPSEFPLVGRVSVGDARPALPRPGSAVAPRRVRASRSRPPTGRARESLVFSGRRRACAADASRIAGQGEGLGTLREVRCALFARVRREGRRHGRVVRRRRSSPTYPENVRGFIKVSGPDMAQLYPLLPPPCRGRRPTEVEGHLVRLPDRWKVTDLSGKVGRSDVAGHGGRSSPTRRGASSWPTSRPTASTIAIWAASWDCRPGRPPPRAPRTQKAEAAKLARQRSRVLRRPLRARPPARVRRAASAFAARAVRVDRVPMDNVEMNIVLDNGVLRYDPVKVGIASGRSSLVGTLDANRQDAAPRRTARRAQSRSRAHLSRARVAARHGRAASAAIVKVRGSGGSASRACARAPTAKARSSCRAARPARSRCCSPTSTWPAWCRWSSPVTRPRRCTARCRRSRSATASFKPRLLVIDTSRVRIDGDGTHRPRERGATRWRSRRSRSSSASSRCAVRS